jgi:hypothetical protein
LPQRALYYPEWGVADPAFLFESLLYWERLACIVPYEGFRPQGSAVDMDLLHASQELHERFVHGIAPSDAHKEAVHNRIGEFIDRPPPAWYRPENLDPEQIVNISALKLAPETEQLLREWGWARPGRPSEERLYETSLAAADLILAALVEELSSETLPPITGDPVAYSATCNALLQELGAPSGLAVDEDTPRLRVAEEAHDAAMVILPFLRFGLGEKPVTPRMLRRLGELRNDDDFNGQRERFCQRVDEYVADVRAAPAAERPLIDADWRQELNRDRNGLRRDLRRAGFDALIDKESLVAVFVTGSAKAFASASLGPAGLAIGLTLAGGRFVQRWRKRRREVASEHWTSFLFSVQAPRLSLR